MKMEARSPFVICIRFMVITGVGQTSWDHGGQEQVEIKESGGNEDPLIDYYLLLTCVHVCSPSWAARQTDMLAVAGGDNSSRVCVWRRFYGNSGRQGQHEG